MSRALYKQVTDDLLAKISRGDIQIGAQLPTEEDYAKQLGVSRSTLRLAFAQLENMGILKRRKRGGTEVISDKPVKKYNLVSEGLFDVLKINEGLATLTNFEFVEAEEVADLINHLDVSKRWLSLISNRFIEGDDFPLICSKIYVPEKYSDLNLQEGDRIEAMYQKIEARYELTVGRVKQSVSTELCNELVAAHLGLTTSDPVLTSLMEIEDKKGNLLQAAIAYFNPARIDLNSDIRVGD